MKRYLWFLFIFLCPVIFLPAAEIGVDTENTELETPLIKPELSPAEAADVKALSNFGASVFVPNSAAAAKRLLEALENNPGSSRILAFILENFRKSNVKEEDVIRFIAIAKANPRMLPLNVAALALTDCVKSKHCSTTDLKRELAENCVAESDFNKFSEMDFKLLFNVVSILRKIYLQRKDYSKGDALFERLFENDKLYKHSAFLREAVIFYSQAASGADDSRRFLWLLPSRASQYAERKKELLAQLRLRSDENRSIKETIKHLAFLQKLNLFDEAWSSLLEQLAAKPREVLFQATLAELLTEQKKYALASVAWQKLLKKKPSDKFVRLKLAETAFKAKRYRLAAGNYRIIMQYSTRRNLSAVFMLMLAELQLGKAKTALELVKMLPQELRFAEIRAHVLSVNDDNKQAFETLSGLIMKAPKEVKKELYFFWLALAVKAESPEVQLKCLKLLKENLDLKDAETANSIGYSYADLNRNLPEAEKLIAYALNKKPDSPEYLDSMAWVLFRMKKYKRAAEYITKAVSREGKYPNAVIADHAGDIFNALNDKKQAADYWNLALKIFSLELDKSKIKNKLRTLEAKSK